MIRIANENDIEQIYNLNTELFIVLNSLNDKIYNPIGFPKQFINIMIKSHESDYIVIEDDDKIIGYVLIEKRESPYKTYESFKEDEFAYIYEVVILPEYRLKGYGKYLIEEAQKWAKKRNLKSIELNVLSNNYSAIAFYEKVGFENYQIKMRKNIS